MRVAVVGAGIMGLTTAWAMARRGHDVTVVEQGAIPNPLGSSVDQHRLIRHAYGAMRGYCRMVGTAYGAWERLWRDLGERLYIETGSLAFGGRDQIWLQDSLTALEAEGHAVELLDGETLARRFPLIAPVGVERGFYLPSGGILLAETIVKKLADHLRARGVVLREKTQARAVDPERVRIELAEGGVIEADRLVVAAGPWVSRLLPSLGRRVTPSRQIVAYMTPPADLAEAWARMPILLDIDPEQGFYLAPPRPGLGMKVGNHSFSMSGDPDLDREAERAETERVYETCRKRLAAFERFTLDRGRSCFYTVHPPEERFIVEPAGAAAWVMSGFTGHGFKFGALMGEAMADALEERRSADAVTRWAAGHLEEEMRNA